MRKASTAEWIFSFVMRKDRAAATVGDLLEVTSGQAWWFWTSVLRIFAASVVRTLLTKPGRIAGVTGLGFFLQFLAPAFITYPFGAPAFFWSVEHHATWVWVSCLLCIMTFTQYWIGRLIAVLSQGNPGAVCVSIGVVNCLAGAFHINLGSLNMAIWQVPIIVGVVIASSEWHNIHRHMQ